MTTSRKRDWHVTITYMASYDIDVRDSTRAEAIFRAAEGFGDDVREQIESYGIVVETKTIAIRKQG